MQIPPDDPRIRRRFDEIFERHYDPLMVRALQLVSLYPKMLHLGAKDLLHEMYIRGVRSRLSPRGPDELLRMLSYFGRHRLVDEVRASHTLRRGGAWRSVPVEDAVFAADETVARDHDRRLGERQLESLVHALALLEAVDPVAGAIVSLRAIEGLWFREVADRVGLSVAQVRRRWKVALMWLHDAMESDADD